MSPHSLVGQLQAHGPPSTASSNPSATGAVVTCSTSIHQFSQILERDHASPAIEATRASCLHTARYVGRQARVVAARDTLLVVHEVVRPNRTSFPAP